MEMETHRTNFAFITVNFIFSSIGALMCFISLVYKLCKGISLPKLWKYSICLLDTSALFFGIGLVMHLCILVLNGTTPKFLVLASSSLMLFGYMDGLCSFITFQTILLFVQNPRKISSTSSHQLGSSIIVLTGIKLACLLLSILPVIPKQDQLKPSRSNLFPLYDPKESGGTYTSLLVICFWIVIVTTFIFSIIGLVKSQKKNSLVHDSSEDVHVSVISQGQLLHKILLVEQCIYTIVSIMITRLLFRQSVSQTTNNDHDTSIITVSIYLTLHGIFTNLGNFLWMKKECCGKPSDISQESRQLKRLELLRTEHSGKHHFLASWIDNKKFLQTGLMKTYSQNWQKLWAQEIMVLGMLRKVKHPNLLQCLWTSNTNPYYEIVSLLSQDTVSSDSRIICMEFPEYGCLREYLKSMETPLSAATQCMIISDVSQGLQQLHRLDILHKHLSSIRVYLRGNNGNNSLFRAALGDFEYVSIFGSLLQGADNPTCKSRQTFFLPDIRSFALITLEMILSVCDKLVQMPKKNRYQNVKTQKSNPQSISDAMFNKATQWQPLVKPENKTVVKGKLGFFPTASEESLHKNWSEMNPNSLDKSKIPQTQQRIKTIFVAPANNANIVPSEFSTGFSRHSSISPGNEDSLSSNISMLVEAGKDSDSEISPTEFNDFISPYEDNKQDDFISENKFIDRKTSIDSDPYNYHWSFFTNKHNYSPHSFFFNEQFSKSFSEENNLNTPESSKDDTHMSGETAAFHEKIQSHPRKDVNNIVDQDYISEENHLRKVQRKNKARMNLQKTLTSRGMAFNNVSSQKQIKDTFKKKKQFNDTQSQKPSLTHINSSNSVLPGNKTILSNPNNHCRPFNNKVNNEFRENTNDYQFSCSSSYQTNNSSDLESSQNFSCDYTTDISCLSSATEALTRKILREEKSLFQRNNSADDIHRKIIDSGFETESNPSNTSNQIICHHNSEKQQWLENCFDMKTKEAEFLPSSDDYLYISNNNFSMQKKSCLMSNQDSPIYSPSNKSRFVYPTSRNGNSCSRSDEVFETSSYRAYDNKVSNSELPLMKSELQNSNNASKRYRELKRKGVPLKISIVSSNTSSNFNHFSNCSPSISACSEVTTPDMDSKNIFFPQQMSPYSTNEHYDRTYDDYQRKNSASLFKQSLGDSPVFTTKVIGSPCPPTPTTTIPSSLFMTTERPILESRISCSDVPDFGGNWKIGPKGNNVQNQDTISVPSRQLSRLNSGSLSHCSSLSHLSLPGKTIQGKYKLLPGVNEHHLGYCIDLVEKQSFLSIDDLLPASQSAFNHLKDKLSATGELTNAAKQLMDIVVSCWYVESPPLAAKLCEQLKDPVMETTV
ncbi:uncharacterized protein LOC115217889 [Octopus sinensis]|uniref:Uncharacterized protein LOC115217889 n=1 Tax=Octopus sinensis TaxID=2607531 RepID=A0A7E6F8Z9_9MOLL|nr:uncharacterized protein LOC115217889 [Octopus sinensis]XP_036363745.1 uncharacterized protein LOC115217889 [Octopus sinensis]XP_036363746.1 uncharacterized protein LOC115217889 [Octopus sinensis]